MECRLLYCAVLLVMAAIPWEAKAEEFQSTLNSCTISSAGSCSFPVPVNYFVSSNTKVAVSVSLAMQHTYVADLSCSLTSPSGTVYTVFNRAGGSTDLVGEKAKFSSDITTPVWSGSPTPTDPYAFATQPSAGGTVTATPGTWTLRITDSFQGDSGTFTDVILSFYTVTCRLTVDNIVSSVW